MGYPNKMGLGYLVRKSNAFDTAENIAASAAVYGGYLVTKPCQITEFLFYVTLAVDADNVAPVVEVNKRPTYNSASGESLIAQITIPDGTAAGKVMRKICDPPVQLDVGDELSFEHVTQATDSGTAAGTGFYDVVLEPMGTGVQSDLVASA